jgi:hypothetical protein
LARTIWGDNARYLSTYWEKFQGRYYVAGDGAHRDADGYFWIVGRIDDVLNVAGHRLGTMEIESALVANPRVAEAAVVGRPHEVKGESVFAYVVCRGPRPAAGAAEDKLASELRAWVSEQLSPIARPDDIRFTDNLPKTRSGKIMRRLLRAIARGEEITQDVSTLENPAIVAQLQGRAAVTAGAGAGAERKTTTKSSAQRKSAKKPAKKKAAPKARQRKKTAPKQKPKQKKSAKSRKKLVKKASAAARNAARKGRKSRPAARKSK